MNKDNLSITESYYENFSEILFDLIEIDTQYNYPIYYINSQNNIKIAKKIIDKNELFSHEHNNLIQKNNIKKLFINSKYKKEYENDIKKVFYKDIKDDCVSIHKKSSLIHSFANSIIQNILEEEVTKEKLSEIKDLVDSSIDIITSKKNTTKVMIQMVSYNYTTYTHSVDVCIYAIGFGTYLNLSQEDLKSLGEGAILHDIGKRDIPNEILNKNGKLTVEEFEVMKNHPTFGKEILIKKNETDKNLLDIVEQHHERYFGGGYPNNLKGDEINYFAQIIAIVDIFNALTTKRPYKPRMKSFEAFHLMKEKMTDNINPELFKKFIKFMSED